MDDIRNNREILRDIAIQRRRLNDQIQAVEDLAAKEGTDPALMRDEAGNFFLTPLINALASLTQSETIIRLESRPIIVNNFSSGSPVEEPTASTD